jgi:hypothetical protein
MGKENINKFGKSCTLSYDLYTPGRLSADVPDVSRQTIIPQGAAVIQRSMVFHISHPPANMYPIISFLRQSNAQHYPCTADDTAHEDRPLPARCRPGRVLPGRYRHENHSMKMKVKP